MFGILVPPQALLGADCSRSAEEVKGLFTEPETFVRRIEEILGERRVVTAEELTLADGRTFERDYIPIFVDEDYRGHLWQYRDTTERKQAERRLEESEQRYKSLVEHNPDAVYSFDLEGNFLAANLACEKVSGYTIEELLQTSFVPLIAEENLEKTLQHFEKAARGEPQNYEIAITHKDGHRVELNVTNTPIIVEGEIVGVYGIAKDITARKRAEKTLRESEERYKAVVERTTDGIFLVDFETKHILESNAALQNMLGYTSEELQTITIYDLIADDRESIDRTTRRSLKDKRSFTGERRYRRKDGSLVNIERSVTLIPYDGREVSCCVVRDITERKRTEEALKESEQRFRQLFEQSVEALIVHDEEGKIVDCNEETCRSLGYTREELLALSVRDIATGPLPEEERREREKRGGTLWQRIAAGEPDMPATVHFGEHKRKDGTTFPIEVRVGGVDCGGKRMILASVRDITERKALEEQLAHRAFHDSLTDLPNRVLFMDRLGHALAQADRRGGKIAVLFVDLDNFKLVNDSLGHEAGDRLLVAVAERLRRCLRPGDTAARLGGDEFTVLLEGVDIRDATQVAERIAEALRAPFDLEERQIFTSVSIGIVLNATNQDEPANLLRNADLALYQAKGSGKAGYAVFDPGMSTHALEYLELGNDLRQALERDEFKVCYQPKVLLETGKILGVEALVRWEHPERGLLLPSDFVPIAEETGLILHIGQRVFEEACRQARAWQEQCPGGPPPCLMCVNLSARQFQHPDLARDIARVLRETGLDPCSLCLEITESAVMKNVQATVATLEELKGLGVKFAIDDFGTGYSSLSYLKRFPVSYLKIDRSFVCGLREDPEDTVLVSGIITLAHTLGMRVIAEGVETAEQLARLREMGCDVAQGNYFSEPVSGRAATAFLANDLRW